MHKTVRITTTLPEVIQGCLCGFPGLQILTKVVRWRAEATLMNLNVLNKQSEIDEAIIVIVFVYSRENRKTQCKRVYQ